MIDAEKLNALVDNELTPTERAEVEALLAESPEARTEAGSIRQLKSALSDHIRPVECNDEWKRCVGRLNEIDKAKKTRAFVDRYAWLMCTGLFAFIIVTGLMNRSHSGLHAGTSDLARASMTNSLDVSRVTNWVKRQFGRAPSIPEEKLHVVAASTGSLSNHPIARFELKDASGFLNLMIIPGPMVVEGVTPMEDGRHFAGKVGEANCVTWSDNGLVMVLSGERDAEELRQISDTIRSNP